MTNFANYTTVQENMDFNRMNSMINRFNDNTFLHLVANVGKYMTTQGKERKKYYNRIYRLARKTEVPVRMLTDWYCMD